MLTLYSTENQHEFSSKPPLPLHVSFTKLTRSWKRRARNMNNDTPISEAPPLRGMKRKVAIGDSSKAKKTYIHSPGDSLSNLSLINRQRLFISPTRHYKSLKLEL